MKDIPSHLLPFQNYSKIFLRKIHPDAHHGYPVVQKMNASIISTINELFKFKTEPNEKYTNIYNLNFFVRSPNEFKHREIFYKLSFNIPFDQISGKSALGLFKAADVSVDFSIIDSFPIANNSPYNTDTRNNKNVSELSEAIKKRCLDLYDSDLPFDLNDARDFLQSRPYIQFEGQLTPEDKSRVLKLIAYLFHILHRIEKNINIEMPIILISERFTCPEYLDKIIYLPLSSSFKGTKKLFKIFILSYFSELRIFFKKTFNSSS